MFESYSDVVNVDEMCEMLKISRNEAYRLLREKIVKSIKIGRIYKIPKKYIVQFLEIA